MKYTLFVFLLTIAFGCKNNPKDEPELRSSDSISKSTNNERRDTKSFGVYPIDHASMVLTWQNTVIYIDPVGTKENYSEFPDPDLILVTDIHPDHLDMETLDGVIASKTDLIVPKAVYAKLTKALQGQTEVIANGFSTVNSGVDIEAIPMYNLREEALQYHPKGRGNGYVLEKNGQRIYISGDTEDIPEMRKLKDIDIAFICMNLPYTMPVDRAADAVVDFTPKVVYPYHYRGDNGFSDVDKFKKLVERENPNIEVIQLEWYPKN